MNDFYNQAPQRWFKAVEEGDISLVKEMLNTHAGLRTSKGETALMLACKVDDPGLAGVLISSEADLCTNENKDALIFAAEVGSCKCLALLLAYTNINRTTDGSSALDIALQREDVPSFRILLRHPRLTLGDLQHAYDIMSLTAPEGIQQLLLATLRNHGVHYEMKVPHLQPNSNPGNSAASSHEHGLELSQTPSVSIWESSSIDQRHPSQYSPHHSATGSKSAPPHEEEITCSMSFLHNLQMVTSESSTGAFDYDQDTPSGAHDILCPADGNATGAHLSTDTQSIDIYNSRIQNTNAYAQTTSTVFTEEEVTSRDARIAALEADLRSQQRESEEQAEVFMSKITSLEATIATLSAAHKTQLEALQKEVESLRASNASLGEEIAVLCQSSNTENISTLLAAAQHLVKSELPSIHISELIESAPNRDNSTLRRQSISTSLDNSIEIDKILEAGASSQQAKLLESFRANIAKKDEQIAQLEKENESLKLTIQSHENSIAMCNTAMDTLMRAPSAMNLVTGISSGVGTQSTPERPVGIAISRQRTPLSSQQFTASQKAVAKPSSRSRKGTPADRNTPVKQQVLTPSVVYMGQRTPQIRSPSGVRSPAIKSPRLVSPQKAAVPKRVVAIEVSPSREREGVKSPLSEDWRLISEKNRKTAEPWTTHTPLMDAVLSRHNHDIHRYLEYAGHALNNGYTALMFACERDNRFAVSILAPLECGMQLHNGDTALTLALRSGHFETAELLRGLEPSHHEVQKPSSQTARKMMLSKNSYTEMMLYAIDGNVFKVFDLLPSQSREKDEHGNTALIYATSNNNLPVVKLLCMTEAGLHNKDGETALMRAVKNNNEECCAILIKHEKRRQDNRGYTALMRAAITSNVAMVRFLAQYEAGIQNEQDDNCTALMYAIEYRNLECAEVLAPKEKLLEDTRGLTALARVKQRLSTSQSQLQGAFIRILS